MKTEIIKDDIDRAAHIISSGGIAAVPTETVYGLAGNALDENAVRKIYNVKGRPEIKALSVMVPDSGAMEKYCDDIPAEAYTLAERFWPGPLTIVLRAKNNIPEIVKAGGTTLGLRCPQHEKTLALLRSCSLPLAAPSANPSGEESPKTAGQVLAYFDGKIDAVIDGGRCGIGKESTIIDMSERPFKILRAGALSENEIADALVKKMTLIGITGGTGCGKTTALNVLREKGALIIDCDEVYHDLTVSSEEMRNEICTRFGDVYNGNTLDRKKLGAIVFNDSAALADLGKITHRYVDMAIDDMLRAHAMNGGTLAAIDAIALLDNGFAKVTAFNVAVTAPTEERIKRLMARENITEEYARMRVNAQKSNKYFTENCDFCLDNSGNIEQFREKCEKFFTEELENVRKK